MANVRSAASTLAPSANASLAEAAINGLFTAQKRNNPPRNLVLCLPHGRPASDDHPDEVALMDATRRVRGQHVLHKVVNPERRGDRNVSVTKHVRIVGTSTTQPPFNGCYACFAQKSVNCTYSLYKLWVLCIVVVQSEFKNWKL